MRNSSDLVKWEHPHYVEKIPAVSFLEEHPSRRTSLQQVHNDPAGFPAHLRGVDKDELWGGMFWSCTTLGLQRVTHADFGRHDDGHN